MVYDENADEIKNAYDKMTGKIPGKIEEDKFYKYFYNLLETGTTYGNFSFVRLLKSVDETWVEAIEKSLKALNYVILNPRKFIEEEREVVNIAMARNISAESVRHLLAHSNYIDQYKEDGTVIPNKILNIYKEESLNTYENRFICTLVGELQFFVNKRFDAIFEASKDELGAYFEMESSLDNYTETVDYKIRIKIKDKQTDTSNEVENEDIFSRIIYIHRQVNMLAMTDFINTMRRYPAVRHPIVKTNAIAKNANYKACHELWNFLHSYTQVGYRINLVKQDPSISKEMEKDMYRTFIWNYAMMHNYMNGIDVLNINHKEREKTMDAKDVKKMVEELVRKSNMNEEQMKTIIDHEITAAFNKVREEKERAVQAEKRKKQSKS